MPTVSNLTAQNTGSTTGSASWTNSPDTAYVTVTISGPGTPANPVVGSGATSATFSNLNPSSTYTVTVTPQDSNHVNGTSSTTTFTTQAAADTTPPTITITGSSATSNSITLNASATDSGSGVNSYHWYQYNPVTASWGSALASTTTGNYTYTGLNAGTSYQLGVSATDNAGNASSMATTTVSTASTSGRPTNFAWTYTKTSGGDFNLTASEWTGFTSRINDFRAYKSLTAYSFTSATTGNDFTAAMFDQAKTAIDAMSPPTATPASVSSLQDIYASYLNNIVTSLNSIP